MLPYESPDVADNKLLDGQIADKAVSVMQEIKDKPFFLGGRVPQAAHAVDRAEKILGYVR